MLTDNFTKNLACLLVLLAALVMWVLQVDIPPVMYGLLVAAAGVLGIGITQVTQATNTQNKMAKAMLVAPSPVKKAAVSPTGVDPKYKVGDKVVSTGYGLVEILAVQGLIPMWLIYTYQVREANGTIHDYVLEVNLYPAPEPVIPTPEPTPTPIPVPSGKFDEQAYIKLASQYHGLEDMRKKAETEHWQQASYDQDKYAGWDAGLTGLLRETSRQMNILAINDPMQARASYLFQTTPAGDPGYPIWVNHA